MQIYNPPSVDLSGYWKSDGSSTATNNWNLGANSIAAEDFNTSDGHGFYSEESGFFTEGADLYIENSATDKNVYLNIDDGGTEKTALFVDGKNAYMGIWGISPQYELDLDGKFHASKDIITDAEFGAGEVLEPSFMFEGGTVKSLQGYRMTFVSEDLNGGFSVHRGARGSEYESPADTRKGDVLGDWQSYGYYNRDWRSGVKIEMRQDGVWGNKDYPSLIAFMLATTGDETPKDYVVLERGTLRPAISDIVDLGSANEAWRDLYVKGTATLGGLNVESLPAQSGTFLTNSAGTIGSTTNKIYWDEATGFLGIGTTTPAKPLHIAGAVANIRLEDTDPGGSTWQVASNDGTFIVRDVTSGLNPFVVVSGAPSSSLYVTSVGSVGIGTAVPTTTLDVNGDITATKYHGDGSELTGIPFDEVEAFAFVMSM